LTGIRDAADVLRVGCVADPAVVELTRRYGVELRLLAKQETVPGSYWGDSEAGLQGRTLFVRSDTPLHSLLHELAHFVCMSPGRRAGLDRDAGGDDAEECGVCYLQILLADELPLLWTAGDTRFGSAAHRPGSSRMRRTPASGCANEA